MLGLLHLRHDGVLSLIAAEKFFHKLTCLAHAMHARLPENCESAYLTVISLMTEPQSISALQLNCRTYSVYLLQIHVQA